MAQQQPRDYASIVELARQEALNAIELERAAKELAAFFSPSDNPIEFRHCQAEVTRLSKRVLLQAEEAEVYIRLAALDTLANVAASSAEVAAAIAASGFLEQAVVANLRPLDTLVQQESYHRALMLTKAVAQAVPLSSAFNKLLPLLVSLAAGNDIQGQPLFHAVWTSAVATLVALSASHSRRHDVAAHMSLSVAMAMLSGSSVHAERGPFIVGLLFANLCDLKGGGTFSPMFGEVAAPFWARHRFPARLAECLASDVSGKPWPDDCGDPWPAETLASACLRLAAGGRVLELQECAAPLAGTVKRGAALVHTARRSTSGPVATTSAAVPMKPNLHAARLAAVALQSLRDFEVGRSRFASAPLYAAGDAELQDALEFFGCEEIDVVH